MPMEAVRVTADFGASYFIDGSRFVTLIFFLKYFVTDPDERSEDAFYTRAVWEHHLGTSGEFNNWDDIIFERDSGPHHLLLRDHHRPALQQELQRERICKTPWFQRV